MENRIFCILGMSGTGKSTIVDCLKNDLTLITPCTTRPMRDGEVNGEDYYFYNKNDFESLVSNNQIVGVSEYKVANGDIWKYGFSINDLNQNKDLILSCNPVSFNKLKELGFNVISILIKVDNKERLKRIYNRNDNQGIDEIMRRNKDDLLVYRRFLHDKLVYNNNSIEDCVNEIRNVIKKYNHN